LSGMLGGDKLEMRFSQVENAPTLPVDLMAPELGQFAAPSTSVQTFLDIDSSVSVSTDFNYENVENDLWRLHGHTESVFWLAITKQAQEEWGMKTVHEEVP
jgi:uncharacterized protein (TIGR04255 family)